MPPALDACSRPTMQPRSAHSLLFSSYSVGGVPRPDSAKHIECQPSRRGKPVGKPITFAVHRETSYRGLTVRTFPGTSENGADNASHTGSPTTSQRLSSINDRSTASPRTPWCARKPNPSCCLSFVATGAARLLRMGLQICQRVLGGLLADDAVLPELLDALGHGLAAVGQ